MKDSIFSVDLSEDFEESVRVDRADKERDNRIDSIETYHLTDDSKDFLEEFILRLLAKSDTMRSGYNYWLYGYYGSGKSHLLTVTDGLMDPSLFQEKGDSLWSLLTDGHDNLEDRWRELHSDYHVIPVSANLLKYQGQKERSFSEIVLRAAHQSEELTGVEGGLSPNMDVAYFEDWYRNTDAWERRDEMVREVLEGVVSDPESYDWSDVQKYGVLAETVLPEMFRRETGSEAGLSDLTPSSMSPETAVERLEELRAEREENLDKPIRLVLLLDEVSLFIGTDFGRLTELQILAESVKEQDGRIHLVVTAQDDVEELRPGLAAKGADVGILKDRFPHRHSLPSRHVGDIAEQRLLRKKEPGRVEDIFSDSAVEIDSIRYRSVKEGDLSLSEARTEDVVSSYPFLPSLLLRIAQ